MADAFDDVERGYREYAQRYHNPTTLQVLMGQQGYRNLSDPAPAKRRRLRWLPNEAGPGILLGLIMIFGVILGLLGIVHPKPNGDPDFDWWQAQFDPIRSMSMSMFQFLDAHFTGLCVMIAFIVLVSKYRR